MKKNKRPRIISIKFWRELDALKAGLFIGLTIGIIRAIIYFLAMKYFGMSGMIVGFNPELITMFIPLVMWGGWEGQGAMCPFSNSWCEFTGEAFVPIAIIFSSTAIGLIIGLSYKSMKKK